MTKKTNTTGQGAASYDAELRDIADKLIKNFPGMPRGTEYEVYQTFDIESDRFADYKKSARLLDESVEINKKCEKLKATLAGVKKQLEECVNDLPENERQDILDGKAVMVRTDLKENTCLLLEIEAEIDRLTLRANGLLHEKFIIDGRIKKKRMTALAVLLYLIEGKQVYDKNFRLIYKDEIIHWLRMHGENI